MLNLVLPFQRLCCATIGASLWGIFYTVIQRNVLCYWSIVECHLCHNAPINVNPQRGGGGSGICGVFDHQLHPLIPTLGILISILAPSWGNLNRMTFINIVFIAIYCKMVGYLTNIYCPTVGHLIENLLKKSNAPPMPDPPPPSGA